MNLKKILAIVLIAGSSLTLLPSCKTDSNPKQNPPTNERNQVEKELKIGGSTSTYAVIKILADAYASKIKKADITFLPPSQSESTIAGVKEGLLDLGSISKQLTPEELGDKLAYREIAKDALLIATHSSVSGEQLKNSPTAVIMRQEPDLIAAICTTPYSIAFLKSMRYT